MIIEDDLNIANLERRHLEKAGFDVTIASTGKEALARLSGEGLPNLLIIDLRLPDMSGIDVLKHLNMAGKHIPSVIVTGAGDEKVAVSAMKLGAMDYIVKDGAAIRELPETCSEVLIKFRLSEENARLVEELKKVNSELVKANRQLGELSRKDGLTGLYNRRTLLDFLKYECAKSQRYNLTLSFGLLDIDHFKAVNDTYGHPVGDIVLRQFAEVLAGRLRRTDLVGRLGGEEFGIVFTSTSLHSAIFVCDELRKLVANSTFGEEGSPIRVTASAGVATLTQGMDHETLIEVADKSLYVAKDSGRNRVEAIQKEPQGDSETKSPVER